MSHANIFSEMIPLFITIGVVAVCSTVWLCMTWNVEPWTRKYLRPFRQWRQDYWRIRIMKRRARFPQIFNEPSPFREQHINALNDLERVASVATEVSHLSEDAHTEDEGK